MTFCFSKLNNSYYLPFYKTCRNYLYTCFMKKTFICMIKLALRNVFTLNKPMFYNYCKISAKWPILGIKSHFFNLNHYIAELFLAEKEWLKLNKLAMFHIYNISNTFSIITLLSKVYKDGLKENKTLLYLTYIGFYRKFYLENNIKTFSHIKFINNRNNKKINDHKRPRLT